jgi:hypothetical protein
LIAQGGAGLFCFCKPDELLERESEQVAEPDQLLQARDVGVGVEPVCAFRASWSSEQPERACNDSSASCSKPDR